MIHKVKIYVPSNLFNKVLIPSNLEADMTDLVNNNQGNNNPRRELEREGGEGEGEVLTFMIV